MQKRKIVFIFVLVLISTIGLEIGRAHSAEVIHLQKEELQSYRLSPLESGFINWRKLDELIHELEKQVHEAPTNATLGEGFEIIEEKPGVKLDRIRLKELFLQAFYAGEDSSIEIPVKPIHPRVDQQMLREVSSMRLGTYTTFFNSSNEERTTNIELSAAAIHGTVVFPGELFSFNKTVGERTEERGYKRAPVIVEGEFSEDIGGGICQVSSTLYNTVDLRGIQMVERYSHSRPVPYVPPGRDATVSWWGPDFTFKNLYNEPILITAQAKNGSLVVEVYSTETVEYFQSKK